MDLERRKSAFVELGKLMTAAGTGDPPPEQLSVHDFKQLMKEVHEENPWFIEPFVRHALAAMGQAITESRLNEWLGRYPRLRLTDQSQPENVGVVMAGNIPLAGFHDLLCVLLAGHRIFIKSSSRDDKLMRFLADELTRIEPGFREYIVFVEGKLQGFKAIMASGSNNSSRYFRYYFGKYPNIIRMNRNSVAILTGDEGESVLRDLAEDVFLYFGLGCRSVSKIFIPEGSDPRDLFPAFGRYSFFADHHHWANNYIYHRSVFLMNRRPHYDNGFVLLTEDKGIGSPPGVIYYEYYSGMNSLARLLENAADRIQCIVSTAEIPLPAIHPGSAQKPEIWDYADEIDTVEFLLREFSPR